MLAAGASATRSPRRSSPARRITRSTCRDGEHAASQGAALAASACAHQIHQARQGAGGAGRRRGVHLGGRAAPALQHGDARGSSGRSRRHLHARQCRALRRPARRGRGGRNRGRGRRSLPRCSRSSTSCCPPCSIRKWPWRRGRRSCTTRASPFRDNIYVDIHGELGSVEEGFAEADAIHEMTYSTSRVQHVHLETHGSLAWRGDDGRLHVRTSSQAPFIAKQKLCYLFGLYDRDVHVFTERIGGGFGGKQEMISEDLCVLAALKTRPSGDVGIHPRGAVHRRHHAPPDEHACEARRQAGRHADRDPGARRVQHRRLRQSWRRDAWRPRSAVRSPPIAAPTRRPTATRSTPTWCRAAGFAAMAPRKPRSPSNAPSTISRRLLGMNPFEIRRINKVRETDRIESIWKDPSDVMFGSYGIDQCLDLVETALQKRPGIAQARGRRLARGDRRRARDAGIGTADRAPLRRGDRLLADGTYHLAVGSTEMGNGSTTSHRQLAASVLNTRAEQHRHHQWRHRPDALRHGHLRQHRHGGRGPGGREDREGDARRCSSTLPAAHPAASRADCRLAGRCRSSAPTARFRWPSCMRPAPRWAIGSRSGARPICRRAPSASTSRACASPCIASPARS